MVNPPPIFAARKTVARSRLEVLRLRLAHFLEGSREVAADAQDVRHVLDLEVMIMNMIYVKIWL